MVVILEKGSKKHIIIYTFESVYLQNVQPLKKEHGISDIYIYKIKYVNMMNTK